MKIGDTFPVAIEGIVVTQAEVEHVEGDLVTLAFPATRVVIKTRTQLTDEGPENTSGTEHIVTGVDRAEAPAAPPVVTDSPTPPVSDPNTVSTEAAAANDNAAVAAGTVVENG